MRARATRIRKTLTYEKRSNTRTARTRELLKHSNRTGRRLTRFGSSSGLPLLLAYRVDGSVEQRVLMVYWEVTVSSGV